MKLLLKFIIDFLRRVYEKHVLIGILASLIAVFAFFTGIASLPQLFDLRKTDKPSQPRESAVTPMQPTRIEYGNTGIFALVGIPSSAKAYSGEQLIAEAEVIGITESSGPNVLEAVETQYAKNGEVLYRGKLVFRFSFGEAQLEKDISIQGIKRRHIFVTWPSGPP
jgi:hypothetical protein